MTPLQDLYKDVPRSVKGHLALWGPVKVNFNEPRWPFYKVWFQ